MTELRSLPIDTQTFEQVRNAGNVYIDKTPYIEKLLRLGRIFFLSRPHRFGKSLFLSTLQAYFEGKKELFEGLYIADHEEELAQRLRREAWEESPVLYFDFNATNYKSENTLPELLKEQLERWETFYGIEQRLLASERRFVNLIETLYRQKGKQIVILIDEYDKPLLLTLQDPELNEANRSLLRAFYEVLKHCDRYIRFAFLTGITKFSKTNLFSGANNLMDISLLDNYAAICGFTEQELTDNLMPEIERLAEAKKSTVAKTRATLKKKYDGYCFSKRGERVYNPFSLIKVLANSEYDYYWFESATPEYVVKSLIHNFYPIPDLNDEVEMDSDSLQNFRYGGTDSIPLLFQSGYLTIKKHLPKLNHFILGFPNEEVRQGFLKNLLPYYTAVDDSLISKSIGNINRALLSGDITTVIEWVKKVLAGIYYGNIPSGEEGQPLREYYYQSVLYALFYILDVQVQTEVICATGRVDMVITTRKRVYLFEFKVMTSGTPQDAIAQLKESGYLAKFSKTKRSIHLVGISFDEKTRNVGAWEEEVLG
ncbi:MAG: AAA family ATPase [Bacteroides sp.]